MKYLVAQALPVGRDSGVHSYVAFSVFPNSMEQCTGTKCSQVVNTHTFMGTLFFLLPGVCSFWGGGNREGLHLEKDFPFALSQPGS